MADLASLVIRLQADVAQLQGDLGKASQQAINGVAPQYQSAITEAYEKANKAISENVDLHGKEIAAGMTAKEVVESQLPGLIKYKESLVDMAAAQRASEDAARDWSNIWTQAGDSVAQSIADVVTKGGSLFKSLADVAKQVVNSIIEYFSKLAIINPLLNSIFGGSIVAGGGSLLPTLANAAVNTGGSGAAGTAANFASTASGNTQFSILSPSSWVMAGKNLWSGWQAASGYMSGGQYAGSSMFGSWSNSAQFAGDMGPGWAGSSTYTPSALGYGAAAAGGIYAGYQRYQDRYNYAQVVQDVGNAMAYAYQA